MSSDCRDSNSYLNARQKYSGPRAPPCCAPSADCSAKSPNCTKDIWQIAHCANANNSGKYLATASRIEFLLSVLNAFLKSIFTNTCTPKTAARDHFRSTAATVHGKRLESTSLTYNSRNSLKSYVEYRVPLSTNTSSYHVYRWLKTQFLSFLFVSVNETIIMQVILLSLTNNSLNVWMILK